MTAAELRAWQAQQGLNFDQAAKALGLSRSAYADLLSGVSRTTGKPKAVDRRTGLACAALAAGLDEWHPSRMPTGEDLPRGCVRR